MNDFAHALAEIRGRIEMATTLAGRLPHSVKLIAVSKTVAAERIQQAISCGQRDFGENYVAEAVDKIQQINNPDVVWHLIGPIQSNKTRTIAEHFDWVHSIDRLKIAERLSTQRPPQRPPLQVMVQVNISGEASKSGVAPEDCVELCRAIHQLPHLQLRGLMAIPAPNAAEPRAPFQALEQLRQQCSEATGELDCLSAGMSDDFEAAIVEGATHVRVGSALFGARSSPAA